MHAIVVREFGNPEVMQVREVPDPQPGAGEVLIRVRAAGVNPVETYVRAGSYANLPALPYIPGLEGAGEVVTVGPGATRFRPGSRVYFLGAPSYAEQTVIVETDAHPLPDDISFEEGAAVGLAYATAHRALFGLGQASPGERLLVHGASGGVGSAALQLARAAGLEVTGTAGSEPGLAIVRTQGARAVPHDDRDGLLASSGGRGFDLILELAAHQNLGTDLDLLAYGGRVLVAGSRGPVEINPRALMQRDAAIIGMMNQNVPPAEAAKIQRALAEGLGNGSLRPIVGRRFALSDAPSAHRAILEPGAQGKVVLTV